MKRPVIALLAALTLPPQALADGLDDFIKRSGDMEVPPATASAGEAEKAEKAQAVAELDMASMMDDFLLTDTAFKTAKGTVVHVSFGKTTNCPSDPGLGVSCDDSKYFALFKPEGGKLYGGNLSKIANYGIFASGSEDFPFDGSGVHTVKLMVEDRSDDNKNIITVERAGRQVYAATIGQILSARNKRARRVTLDKEYMVFLSQGLTQSEDKELSVNPAKSLFTFIPVSNTANFIQVDAGKLTAAGVSVPELGAAYKLAVKDGKLLITK
ncbi:MAG: hypothetical protein PHP45_07455 [Elusimicrobiales bacterium]|nr:hypothetical protein [Elusimicrobiales bacterium]